MRTKEVLQRGGSILGSVILCGTFRRMSQLWDNAHTLNLENCLLYLSSTISHFFDFIRSIVFDFIFYIVTVHTLYSASGPSVLSPVPQHLAEWFSYVSHKIILDGFPDTFSTMCLLPFVISLFCDVTVVVRVKHGFDKPAL